MGKGKKKKGGKASNWNEEESWFHAPRQLAKPSSTKEREGGEEELGEVTQPGVAGVLYGKKRRDRCAGGGEGGHKERPRGRRGKTAASVGKEGEEEPDPPFRVNPRKGGKKKKKKEGSVCPRKKKLPS